MEDIYTFALGQKHHIETEYFNIKSNDIDTFSDLDIKNISTYYENLILSIENCNKQITDIEINKKKQLDDFKAKTKLSKNKFLTINQNIIEQLLSKYDNGIYGIINYFASHSDEQLIKFIISKQYEYNNKPTIISKLIKNGTFTSEAKLDAYGIIFMYEKSEDEISDLHKVHLLKNGNIYKLNNSGSEEEEEDELDSETESEIDDKIGTKVYEFGTKIVLKEIIYESELNRLTKMIESDESTNNFIEESEDEVQIKIKLEQLTNKKSKLENLYKIDKKYKKYLFDNVKSSDINELLQSFTFVKSLLKKIADPSKQQLDIKNLLKHDFSNNFEHLKISNRLDRPEYDSLIEKYFDSDTEQLTLNILELYDINNKFKPYLSTLFEILSRIYIDDHLGLKSYCLNKNLAEYFNFSAMMAEPDTQTTTLKRRHWTQLFETSDPKKVITSILILIKTKTKSIDQTLKYFETLYMELGVIYKQNNK
jgi:hypothetical protein